MFNQGIQSYRKVNVTTSNSGQLILMCYEGVIDNLKIAKHKYIENDYEGKCKAINKALDIIAELKSSLDFKKGGSTAKSLDAVYSLMTGKILQADIDRDLPGIDNVIGMLSELLSAWKELLTKPDNQIQSDTEKYNFNRMPKEQGYIRV